MKQALSSRYHMTVNHNQNVDIYRVNVLSAVKKRHLTEMTLSTSFFANWKVLTPSERSMRSEKRQKIHMSAPPGRKSKEP